jgi:hypothetical protein
MLRFLLHRARPLAIVALVAIATAPVRAGALEVQVGDVRAQASAVRAAVDVRDPLPDRFRKQLAEGAVLHLRVQAELWENRPVWDRLVYPAIVRVFRLARGAAGKGVSLTDAAGEVTGYPDVPNPLRVPVDLGAIDRIAQDQRYYVHIVATIGTLADREIDDMGNAVFGRPEESNTLGALGRSLFRTVLQISDYIQSVTAETKSKKLSGKDILKP